jgi:putative sigma-54 modulation protein
MRLTITGRHVVVTSGLRQLVEKKVARLVRVLNTRAVSGQVELSLEKIRHVAEILVHVRGGHVLQGRAVTTSWGESVADAADRIVQQADTLKGKWVTRKRAMRPVKRVAASAPVATVPPAETVRRIVRAKRYSVKPMSLDEAAASVGEREDAFVVFRNPETDAVSVMFRRGDGDLGLIEPKG